MRTTRVAVISIVLLICVGLGLCSEAQERIIQDMFDFMASLFKNDEGEGFLRAHRLLEKDTEHVGFVESLLEATTKGDADGIKGLFARNAIREIGDETVDNMIESLIRYCQFTTYSVVVPSGASTEQLFQDGKNYKILKGPLELNTDIGEYRLAVKCCAFNEGEPDDVGLWSVYIIAKERDTDQDRPYCGDLSYRTGIYFDVARIR